MSVLTEVGSHFEEGSVSSVPPSFECVSNKTLLLEMVASVLLQRSVWWTVSCNSIDSPYSVTFRVRLIATWVLVSNRHSADDFRRLFQSSPSCYDQHFIAHHR
jgi:hypothetical protein